MSRLSAILLLCLAFSIPALATDEAGAPADEPADPMESVPAPALPAVPELEDLPPEVLEKLDPEQIVDLLQSREETKIALAPFSSSTAVDLVPILVPLGLFLAILLGLIATLVLRYRKHAHLQETLRLMIEKGADIPPELIAPPVAPYGDLRRGVVLVGAGLSLAILVGLVWGFASGAWAVGLIPAFIGAGYLFVWRLSRRAESR
jgi:hypothetical protein